MVQKMLGSIYIYKQLLFSKFCSFLSPSYLSAFRTRTAVGREYGNRKLGALLPGFQLGYVAQECMLGFF